MSEVPDDFWCVCEVSFDETSSLLGILSDLRGFDDALNASRHVS